MKWSQENVHRSIVMKCGRSGLGNVHEFLTCSTCNEQNGSYTICFETVAASNIPCNMLTQLLNQGTTDNPTLGNSQPFVDLYKWYHHRLCRTVHCCQDISLQVNCIGRSNDWICPTHNPFLYCHCSVMGMQLVFHLGLLKSSPNDLRKSWYLDWMRD